MAIPTGTADIASNNSRRRDAVSDLIVPLTAPSDSLLQPNDHLPKIQLEQENYFFDGLGRNRNPERPQRNHLTNLNLAEAARMCPYSGQGGWHALGGPVLKAHWIVRLAVCAVVAWGGISLLSPRAALADYQHLSAKPEYKFSDDSNVDLLSGQLSLSVTDVSIGQGDGSLSHTLMGAGNGLWPNSLDYYSFGTQDVTTIAHPVTYYLATGENTCGSGPGTLVGMASVLITTGASSERFCAVGGAFVSYANKGGALTWSGGVYIYTDKAGIEYTFPVSGPVVMKYPSGVTKKIYPHNVVSSTGYQLHYDLDSSGNLSSVTAFNTSVDYCDPNAVSCTYSRSWPTSHYTMGNVVGVEGVGTGLTGYDVTFKDQYNRITASHRESGYLTVTTPESSVVGNYTYTLCDYDNGVGFTTSCNANMGTYATSSQKLGHIVSSTYNGTLTTYDWIVAGVPYTGKGTSIPSHGIGRTVKTTAGCNNGSWLWDSCIDYLAQGDGQYFSFDHTQHGILTGVSYDANMGDTYAYDARGNVTATTRTSTAVGLSPITVSSNFDATCTNLRTCNQPNYTIDANGNRTDYTYDAVSGQVLTITGPADASGVRPQTRNTYALLYPYVKNSVGTLVPSTGQWMLTRSSSCMTATAANPASCVGTDNEVVTVYAYNSNNLFLTSKTVMSGSPTTNVSQAYSATNLWQTTTYTYDDLGNMTSEDGPLPGDVDKTVYRYNSIYLKTGVVGPDPDGTGPLPRPATRTTYNAAAQITLVESGTMTGQAEADWANFVPQSQVATFYDAYGRTAMVKTSSGGVLASIVQTSYEPTTSRVSCVATRMNLSLSFAVTDNACAQKTPTSTQFGPDRIVKNTYDALDHVTKIERGYGTTLVQAYATYTYTSLGLKTSEMDANGNKSVLSYDGFDRLAKLAYPSTTVGSGVADDANYEYYIYDANGNRTAWRRRDGRWIYDAYDHLGRVVQTNVSDSSIPYLFSDYDLLGRPCITAYSTDIHTQGPDCTTLFTGQTATGLHYKYNALGQLLTVKDTNNRMLAYQYNQASVRTRLTYPDNSYITSDLDNLNRLIDIKWGGSTTLFSQTYNSLGLRASLSRGAAGEGGSSSYTWDNLGRLTHLTNDLSGTATDITWNFTDGGGSPAYSPAGQLTGWNSTSTVYDYTDGATSTESHAYDGLNRDAGVVIVNGSTGYDTNGNVHNDGARYMVYDIYNRLVSVAASPTGQPYLTLTYDPQGRLATSTFNGVLTSYLYDGTNLIGEYDSTNAMIRRYVHGSGVDEPLVWFEGAGTGTKSYFYQDYHGSVIAVANSSGGIDPTGYPLTAIYKYGPYGEPLTSVNPLNWSQTTKTFSGSRFRYTGQTTLPEANLYYYKAREYDPIFGRFLQTDPIGSKEDLDLYVYVGGDPINKSDPLGLCPVPCRYATVDQAGNAGANDDRQQSNDPKNLDENGKKVEYGGDVVSFGDGSFGYTQTRGTPMTVRTDDNKPNHHNHVDDDPRYDANHFSKEDKQNSDGTPESQKQFLATPDEGNKMYDPNGDPSNKDSNGDEKVTVIQPPENPKPDGN